MSTNIIKQGIHFAQAVVKHVVGGLEEASEEEQGRRLAICESCEFRSPDWKCMQCGCPLSKKAAWANEKCPINRWETKFPPAPSNLDQLTTSTCGGCGS